MAYRYTEHFYTITCKDGFKAKILVGRGRSFFVRCLGHQSLIGDSLLLQIFSGAVYSATSQHVASVECQPEITAIC